MLFQTHEISSENIINELLEHSFSSKNLVQFVKNTTNSTNIITNKQNTNKQNTKPEMVTCKNNKYFDPAVLQKDSLFWCFYVLVFGFDKYDMLGNQHFVEEKKIKFQYIEILRNKKDILKMYKIKPLSEIEDELANKEFIEIKTFIALCIVSNLNVMIIDKHKYYEINMNDNADIAIINKYTQPLKFVMDLEVTNEKLNDYRNKFFKLENLNYKLKSINSYKIDELIIFCDKLGIKMDNDSSTKKLTKKALYDEILLHF
jgi:hypothetical protein